MSEYDAKVICDDKQTADFFEAIIKHTGNYKAAANWLLGPVKSYLNENNISINNFPIAAKTIAKLIQLIDQGKLSFTIASSKIFPGLISNPSGDPLQIATQLNLLQENNDDAIILWVNEVINNMPEKVSEYKKGKKALMGLFAGEVKKLSKGKADMKMVNKLLAENLNK